MCSLLSDYQLELLTKDGESASFELKRSLSDSRKIIETIAAMATIGGGRVLVGMSSKGQIVGFEPGEGDQERLVQRILAATDPKVYVDVERRELGGLPLLEIRVPAGDGPHLAYGRAFYRSGPATVAMTRAEYERRLLDRLREANGFERRIEGDWTLDLLDEQAAREFVEKARRRRKSPAAPGPALDPGSPRQLLERLHLLREQRLTAGGVLLFGRDPQGPLPQATIRARAHRGTFEDVESIEGNLFSQIELTTRFVSRNLKMRVRRDASVRQEQPEIPTAAVREVVANAVAHRDYRSTAPIQLRLDEVGLTLWNPGHFPAPITAASLRGEHPSVPTNPFIARALYLAGYIEEWGTGTNRVIAAMAASGNPEPTFDDVSQPGGIRVVLPLPGAIPAGLSNRQTTFLVSQKSGERFTTTSYATASGIARRTALNDLKQLRALGLVEREGLGKASHWVRR